MRRYWVNQPSALQPDHKYHGRKVLADLSQADERGIVPVYFVSGNVSNSRMYTSSLSSGWPEGDRYK